MQWGHMFRGWLKLKPSLFHFASSAHSCASAGHLWSSFSLNWEWLFKGSLHIIPAHLSLLRKTGNKKKPHAGPLSLSSFCVSGPIKDPERGSTPAPQHLGHPSWLKNPLHGFPSCMNLCWQHPWACWCWNLHCNAEWLFQEHQKLSRYGSKSFHVFLHPL